MGNLKKAFQSIAKKLQTETIRIDIKDDFCVAQNGVKNFAKIFKCSICSFSTKWPRSIKIHIRTVHEFKKPFKCEICQISFSQNGSMKIHKITVHGNEKFFIGVVAQAK